MCHQRTMSAAVAAAAALFVVGSATDCGVPDASHPPSVQISGGKLVGVKQGIAGGQEAVPHSFPWMVSLNRICGASLLNERWVLTAAHCVVDSDGTHKPSVRARLGVHDEGGSAKKTIESEQIVVHPQYKQACRGNGYDIALVKLSRPVQFTDKIKPICLPSRNDNLLTQGDKFIAAGWGKLRANEGLGTHKLQQAVMVTAQDDCRAAGGYVPAGFMNAATEFCGWGGYNTGQTTCSGDSGGPQFVYRGGKYVQMGIASCGSTGGCGSRTKPAIFTHVPAYVDWINQHIGN